MPGEAPRSAETPPPVRASLESKLETARQSRTLTVSLGGTCVAIFTFLLFFLYPRLVAGEVDPLLFRLSFGDVIVSLFLLVYGSSFFFWALLSLERGRGSVEKLIFRGDWCFALATIFLVLAPALILYTVDLPDLGTLSLALWLVYLVFLFGGTARIIR